MEPFTNCKSNSLPNSKPPQKGSFSMSWLAKHPNPKKIKLSSSIKDYFSLTDNDNQVQLHSIDGQLSLVPSPDKSKNIKDKNNTIGNGLFKDITLEKCNVNDIGKKASCNSVSVECSKSDNFPLDKEFSDDLAVENSRISDNSSKTATEPIYSADSLKEVVPKTLPKLLDIGHSLPISDTRIGSAEKSLEPILTEDFPVNIEKNGNSEEIQSNNSSNILYKLLTSEEFLKMENCSTNPETILSKTCKKITNLPKSQSFVSEQRQTDDLGSDQNIPRKEDAPKSQSENHRIFPKVAKRMSAMQKFVPQREALEDVSSGSEKCPSEESGSDQNISTKESLRKEDASKSQSENDLIVPKVGSRLSAKKAIQKFVSQKEALEDIPSGSEESLTEESGNDQNISSIEDSPKSWSERDRLIFPKVAKRMSAKKPMQKLVSPRKALEDISSGSEKCPSEESACDQNISAKESSRKEDASKSQSENDLIVPKVARRLSAKKAMEKFVSQREALEDVSSGSEACLTEESDNDQNISSMEDSPKSWSERDPIIFPKVAKRVSAKKAKFVSQREALEDISSRSEKCPSEESGSDQNISSKESLRKDDVSKSQSENRLIVPKVGSRLSAKKAIKKFVSQKEVLEDIPSGSEESLTEESGNDQNISSIEDSPKSWSERDPLIFPKVAKRMSSKKPMQKLVSPRKALEDISSGSEKCASEESACDQNISAKESSRKEDASKNESENDLIVSKAARRLSAKKAMEKFVSQREALEDVSSGSEACLTEESDNDQNISSIEDSPKSWLERDPVIFPKVAKRVSAKKAKFVSQREALEDISSRSEKCPSEESGSDQNISSKESLRKDDVSKSQSENRLIVPKVARRLSTKNAMQKFVSKRESASRNSKKWLQRKKVTYDDEFLGKEWDKLNSSSGSKVENHSDATSNGHKSLKRNLQSHSKYSGNVFTCQTCDIVFGKKSELMKHERSHDKKRSYECDECGKNFTQLSSLRRHERIHKNMKSYSCDHCSATFTQNSSLTRHQKIHKEMPNKLELYSCEFCEKSFKEKHHLKAHINSLHGAVSTEKQRQYTCNICGAMFLRHSSFWLHKKIHDRNKSDAYKCKECGKLFSTNSNLSRHRRQAHSEMTEDVVEKPFKCLVCNEQFSTIVSLKQHTSSHNTKDLYHCVLCEKTFTHKQWLIKHMASHRGSKYACEQCGRVFHGSFQLKLHKRTTGGKCTPPMGLESFKAGRHHLKYVCKYCNRRCSLSSRLAKHIRKDHPEVEVFTCDVCNKGFCYYQDFSSHRKTHRNIPFQCKPCGVAFPRQIQLFEHRKNHLKPLDTSAASSASNVPADNGIFEKSLEPGTESDLGVEPGLTVSCSKTESDNSTEALNAEILKVPEKISNGLKCQHCCLVFLTKLGYRRHCRLVHGEEKFVCRKCGLHFDHQQLYNLHLKKNHGKPKAKVERKRKSAKIVKPKTAPKYDSARLQKLLRDKVKESMMRSKLKQRSSFGAKKNNNKTFTLNSYIID